MIAAETKCTSTSGNVKRPLLMKLSKKTCSKTPSLRWGEDETTGISSSGVNPFSRTRISLVDEAQSKNKISLIIEPSAPGSSVLVSFDMKYVTLQSLFENLDG
jgi:hypothetical protein